MAKANYSDMVLRKRREATEGTVDNTGGPHVINMNSESLQGDPNTVRSAISRSDRRQGPSRKVGQTSGGAVTADMNVGGQQFKEALEEMMCSSFSSDLNISSTAIDAAVGDNSINGTGLFTNVVAGMFIRIEGFATAGNNTDGASGRPHGAFVVSATDDKVVVSGITLATEAAGATVTVKGSYVRDGASLLTSTYERDYGSGFSSDRYRAYPGVSCNGGEINISAQAVVTVNQNLLGIGVNDPSSASIFTQADVTETIDDIVDGANNITGYAEDGTANPNIVNFTMSINNNLSPRMLLQQRSAEGMNLGISDITGTIDSYFEDGSTRQDNAASNTPQRVDLFVVPDDATAPVLTITVFALKFDGLFDPPREQQNGAVLVSSGWMADVDQTYNCYAQFGLLPRA